MKRWIVPLVMVVALGAGVANADAVKKTIDVYVGGIGLVVDGKTVVTDKEPFLYGGTTYVPIRVVADALGKPVAWDAEHNRVVIGTGAVRRTAQLGTLPLADWHWSDGAQSKSVKLGGTAVSPVAWMRSSPWGDRSAEMSWALGGDWGTLAGKVGVPDGGYTGEMVVTIVGDGAVLAELKFVPGTPAQSFQVDVRGVRELRVGLKRLGDSYAEVAVSGALTAPEVGS